MAWHPDVNGFIRKLRYVNPIYETDAEIEVGIKGNVVDRGNVNSHVIVLFFMFIDRTSSNVLYIPNCLVYRASYW